MLECIEHLAMDRDTDISTDIHAYIHDQDLSLGMDSWARD